MLSVATPLERAIIHQASAPGAVSVGVETEPTQDIRLQWGSDQTIVVRVGSTTFRARAPTCLSEDEELQPQ